MTQPCILFIHRNFPGQFRSLAPYLVEQGWTVYAASGRVTDSENKITTNPQGVKVIGYRPQRAPRAGPHAYLRTMDNAVLDGQGFATTALKMRNSGITPDIIVAHSGWGSGTYAKAVWPNAKFVPYIEWWYSHPPRDVDPPKQPPGAAEEVDKRAKALTRNLPFLLDGMQADAMICPSAFQAEDIPDMLRGNLHILPDGVDCDFFHPAETRAPLVLGDRKFDPATQIVTYATRGMEPMRGFPEFMAAWAKVQHEFPQAQCIVAGTDTVHYGPKLPAGDSYLKRALAADGFDRDRLHMVGRLSLSDYAGLLRRSDCHVYLTKPFVLSWSLTEAMASGCPLVVSDVPPVREVLPQKSQAVHVDHSDIDALAAGIMQTLKAPEQAQQRGTRVRKLAKRQYTKDACHKKFEDLFLSLAKQA